MSGSAGASIQGTYYLVEFSSGLSINVQKPPWASDSDNHVAEYFSEASKPYEELLNKVKNRLDKYFETLSTSGVFPIVEYNEKSEWIYGVVIEDTDPDKRDRHDEKHGKNWLTNSKKAALVSTKIFIEQLDHKQVKLTFAINRQILRSQIKDIERKVQELFEKAV